MGNGWKIHRFRTGRNVLHKQKYLPSRFHSGGNIVLEAPASSRLRRCIARSDYRIPILANDIRRQPTLFKHFHLIVQCRGIGLPPYYVPVLINIGRLNNFSTFKTAIPQFINFKIVEFCCTPNGNRTRVTSLKKLWEFPYSIKTT
jgi:hypothetical protein